jgi:hypothetical protein
MMQVGGKRLFQLAFASATRSTPPPGSASASEVDVLPPSADEYKGGRRLKQRFGYKAHSKAALIELAPEHVITVKQFRIYHFRQMDMSPL